MHHRSILGVFISRQFQKSKNDVNGYLPVPVNSADSTDFTGTFTIPYLNNEYTNQTRSLVNLLF